MEDHLGQKLQELIQELGPDAKIPSERDLCALLGVSRTALRDRLQVLVGLGVLRRFQGSGTYVQRLDPAALTQALEFAISTLDLSEASLEGVRLALERQAAMEAAIRHDGILLSDVARSLAIITHGSSDEEVDQADYDFHFSLVRASGNEALIFFATALSSALRPLLAKRRAAMRRRLANDRREMIETHTRIYTALASGDPASAAAAIDHHFDQFHQIMLKISAEESEPARVLGQGGQVE